MDEVIISDKQIEQIASRTATILYGRLKNDLENQKELVSVKEAARILGVTTTHMRNIKDDYAYIRRGKNQKGNIFFIRESLTAVPEKKINDNK